MEGAYWYLPLTAVGVLATTVAHVITLAGLATGSVVEGNPFALFLRFGRPGIPLASGVVGGAYILAWAVGNRSAGSRQGVLAFRAIVLGMTVFFLLDAINDSIVFI